MCLHVAVLVGVLRAHGTESAGMAEEDFMALRIRALKDDAIATALVALRILSLRGASARALVAAGACQGE